jgi:two-component system, OmpR family, heavy metal sensor histidine kinase CusS
MWLGRSDRPFATLRFRLALWNTIALLLLGAATLVGLRQGLQTNKSRDLSRLAVEDANGLAARLAERPLDDAATMAAGLNRKARSCADRDYFGQILREDGNLLAESTTAPSLDWPSTPVGQPFDLGDYRVLQRAVRGYDGSPLLIRVGSSVRIFVTEDVNNVTKVIALVGIAILLIAPPFGYWLAGRATRPLQNIISTTERLRPGAMTERLPLRGTGDELDQLSTTINGFLDRIAGHLANQREFVANSAHELRSPLAALRTSVEVSLQRDRTPAEYQDLLADVAEEVAGLSGLVNQLLLLAEGDADRLQPGSGVAPLADVAVRAADMFQGVADQGGVKLNVVRAEPVAIRGDTAHIRQVIQNLLDNAIKFTPQGGSVEIAVGPGHNGHAELIVRDTGIGIAAADLPHVFDRFFRADRSRSRDGHGTGLGLSICQVIVTAYGGHLAITSMLGKGTTVTVDLPKAE